MVGQSDNYHYSQSPELIALEVCANFSQFLGKHEIALKHATELSINIIENMLSVCQKKINYRIQFNLINGEHKLISDENPDYISLSYALEILKREIKS